MERPEAKYVEDSRDIVYLDRSDPEYPMFILKNGGVCLASPMACSLYEEMRILRESKNIVAADKKLIELRKK